MVDLFILWLWKLFLGCGLKNKDKGKEKIKAKERQRQRALRHISTLLLIVSLNSLGGNQSGTSTPRVDRIPEVLDNPRLSLKLSWGNCLERFFLHLCHHVFTPCPYPFREIVPTAFRKSFLIHVLPKQRPVRIIPGVCVNTVFRKSLEILRNHPRLFS